MISPAQAPAAARRGFTLIELLTVIAIIALLAGITFTVLPRVREKARLTNAVSTMKQVQTVLVSYMADNGSYPPMYGYVSLAAREVAPADLNYSEHYHLEPYLAFVKSHGQTDLYDTFSESGDTNRDGQISLLEYSPVGQKNLATGYVTFNTSDLYFGSNLAAEVNRQLNEDERPYVYIGVNASQARQARRYWIESNDFYGNTWNRTDSNALRSITFPPSKIDTFVLVSVGPGGSTGGILDGIPTGNYSPLHTYHVVALRAYYLATRDLNENGYLDFEFQARTQQKEGAATYPVNGQTVTNQLPDPNMPNGAGPVIYVVN